MVKKGDFIVKNTRNVRKVLKKMENRAVFYH